MSTKDKIIRTAGLRGKTKTEIADSLGMNPSHIGKVVNDLVYEGKLVLDRTTKTGASVFRKLRDGESAISSAIGRAARKVA